MADVLIADKDDRLWGMFCHLGGLSSYLTALPGVNIIVPLILWNLKKDGRPFVDDQGKESMNFQISVLLYLIVTVAAGILLGLSSLGMIVIPVLMAAHVVLTIYGAIQASRGDTFRYPLTVRLIK